MAIQPMDAYIHAPEMSYFEKLQIVSPKIPAALKRAGTRIKDFVSENKEELAILAIGSIASAATMHYSNLLPEVSSFSDYYSSKILYSSSTHLNSWGSSVIGITASVITQTAIRAGIELKDKIKEAKEAGSSTLDIIKNLKPLEYIKEGFEKTSITGTSILNMFPTAFTQVAGMGLSSSIKYAGISVGLISASGIGGIFLGASTIKSTNRKDLAFHTAIITNHLNSLPTREAKETFLNNLKDQDSTIYDTFPSILFKQLITSDIELTEENVPSFFRDNFNLADINALRDRYTALTPDQKANFLEAIDSDEEHEDETVQPLKTAFTHQMGITIGLRGATIQDFWKNVQTAAESINLADLA
jgi:hypothetical protein